MMNIRELRREVDELLKQAGGHDHLIHPDTPPDDVERILGTGEPYAEIIINTARPDERRNKTIMDVLFNVTATRERIKEKLERAVANHA